MVEVVVGVGVEVVVVVDVVVEVDVEVEVVTIQIMRDGFKARGVAGKKLGTFPKEWEAQAAIDADRVQVIKPSLVRVDEWLSAWRVLFPGEASPETMEHDRYMVAPFVRAHGEKRVCEVSALLAQAWTIEKPGHVKFLKRPWAKAVLMGIAPVNVWRLVEVPKSKNERRRPPTSFEFAGIVSACHAKGDWWVKTFANLVVVAAYTGLRERGVASLRRSAVDLDAWRVIVMEKGSKTRTIALVGPAREAMRKAMAQVRGYEDEDPLVFLSQHGRPLSNDTIGTSWREVRGDFPHGFHSLRHYAATWLAKQGVDPLDIAIQLGHTDARGRPYPGLLERVYDHHVPDQEGALARLELAVAERRSIREGRPFSLGDRSKAVLEAALFPGDGDPS